MTEVGQQWIQWETDDEGGISVTIETERGTDVKAQRQIFDSIDQLPERLRLLIEEHGGKHGEVVVYPNGNVERRE